MEKETGFTNFQHEKIKEYGKDPIEAGDLVMLEGKLHRAVECDTGYTIREYYSHSTPEKGPGPGWDSRFEILEKYGVNDPSELPNEPFHRRELRLAENQK